MNTNIHKNTAIRWVTIAAFLGIVFGAIAGSAVVKYKAEAVMEAQAQQYRAYAKAVQRFQCTPPDSTI